jgi:serine/threonine protein kinase/tetratricopeptide (TPR) repeat protein
MDDEPRVSAANAANSVDPDGRLDGELSRTFGFDGDLDAWVNRVALAVHGDQSTPDLGVIAGFTLLERVARGGQGSVFRAVDPRTGRQVAIKRLTAGMDSRTARLRFEREAEVVASLRHPNIVTLFAADEVDGHHVLVMEWIDGEPFDRWADGQRRNRSPKESIASIVGCAAVIADAVAHAHRNGVIHRDLKPSNVLVDADGAPHVLDFGLARVLSNEGTAVTETSGFLGTPSYAAPEQVAGRSDVDARADVHALGAMIYRALVGAHPFDDRSPLPELFRQIAQVEPSSPSRRSAFIGRELGLVVMKALAKEPVRRYQSMDELAADLRRTLTGERVLAHPNELSYVLRKAIARHPGAFGLGCALLVLLVAATVISSSLAYRLDRERARVESSREQESIARRDAEARAREAQAARERGDRTKAFLQDMFATVRAASAGGAPLSVASMLDLTRATLERDAHPPDVEADLRETLARAYAEFGDGPAAIAEFDRAIELRRRQAGESRALVSSLVGVGEVHRGRAEYERALVVLAEAIETARAAGAQDLLFDALDLAARCTNDVGGPANALPAAEEALGIATTMGDAWRRACALSTLALIAIDQGRNDDAMRWARESVAGVDLEDRARLQQATRLLHNLAFVALSAREYDLCIETARECVALRDGLYGKGDSRSLTPWSFVARAYAAKGDFATAFATYDEAIAAAEQHHTGREALFGLRTLYVLTLEEEGSDASIAKAQVLAERSLADWLAHPDERSRRRLAQLCHFLGRQAVVRGDDAEFARLYDELPERIAQAGGTSCTADLVRVQMLRSRPRRTEEQRAFAGREVESLLARVAECGGAGSAVRFQLLELSVRVRRDVGDERGALERARTLLEESERYRGRASPTFATAERWVAELSTRAD